MQTKIVLLISFILLLCSNTALSTDYYWVGGSGDWNDGGHWSNSSGGSPLGTIPGKDDKAIFDATSLTMDFSLIHITSNISIGDLYIDSKKFASFHGSNVNLTISGNLTIKSKAGFYLGGKIFFKNNTTNTNKIVSNNIDFYTDLSFDSGVWELDGHLKTGQNYSISFNAGKIISNGFTIHSKDIFANKNLVELDFTGSHISVLERFDVSKAKNIGGIATYLVQSGLSPPAEYVPFLKKGDETKDATVFCTTPPFELNLFITSDFNGENISCFDSCDGEIMVVASGTPGPFSYRLGPAPNPFGAANTFSGLCVGSVSVTVTDSSNELAPGIFEICTINDDLNEPPVLSFDPPVTISPSCPDICDGQAFSFPTGGTGALTINWPNSGETTPFPVMLCVGDNPVVIMDANGCSINDTVTIADPPDIVADPTITPPTCNGDCDAEILLNPSGGNGGPFTFSWSPVPTDGDGANPGVGFCSGTVDLTITDASGCNYDTSIVILDPPALIVTVDGIVDASCNGMCDGEANAVVAGGVPGFTFEWFDNTTGLTTGITDQTATGLCAGDYFVQVTDDNGCIRNSPIITINEPAPYDITVDTYDISCFGICDGAADIDISGGTPPYTFDWTTFPDGLGIGATDSISGLCPGEYQIIVTDDNGCSSPPTVVEVFEPTEITIAITGNDPSCFDLCDGDASAAVGGGTPGYTYSWLPLPGTGGDTPNPSEMCADTYTLTVTDMNGCMNSDMITLDSPDEYDITSVVSDLLCFGDTDASIDITINSGGSGMGYTFDWTPTPPIGDGTGNVSGLDAGVWTVIIGDSEMCDTTLTFTITSPPELVVNANLISNASCNGDCDGSAQVIISGGTPPYTVLWDDPLAQTTLVASGLCAGTYNVTVTDDNGCMNTATVDITEPAAYDITTTQVNPLCFGDCDATATITINSGGIAPYTILWDDPLMQTTFTAIGLCAGTYNATITDNNLCDTIITVIITEPAELIVSSEPIDSACFGTCTGSAFVNIMGGTPPFTFEWFDAITDIAIGVDNDSIFDLCPGDYYAIVTDGNGCSTQSADVTVEELDEIITSIISTTDATCALCDGTAEISATGGAGGFTFDWDPDPGAGDGTSSVSGLCAGAYTVTVTDDAGCIQTLAVSIDNIALEVLDLDSVDVTCFGFCDGEASASFVSLDPPYTLEWFDNITGLTTGIFGSPATGLCAGEYLAVLTNATGCVTTEVITVNEPTEITGIITTTDVTCAGFCDGTADIVVSGGVPPYTYDWGIPLPGSGEGTPNVSGLCAGPWEVEVTDSQGCIAVFTTTINEPTPIVIDAESSTGVSCFGDTDGTASVIASGGTVPLTYEWFDCMTGLPIGQTDPLATGLGAGSYQVTITDANGCNITSSCITVDDAPEITAIFDGQGISCFGLCDGLITVVPGGGAGTYFFQWLDEFGVPLSGQTNDSLENICQGLYNLEITDINGCSQIFGPIDRTSPISPWDIETSQTSISCAGECDATATVNVLAGNTPPYTYLWDDPLVQTTPTASFLCEGTYTVIISDAGSVCDTSITFTIIDSSPIFANLTDLTNATCFGECTGEITVAPTGGVAPYTLNWSDGQTGLTATGICAGPITLTITDATGCDYDTTFTITEGTEITTISSFSNNTSCGVCNGSATVNVSGGLAPYTYDWSPDPLAGEGTNNATGLCPGVTIVEITDANGCMITESFAISDVMEEDVVVLGTDASCFGICDGSAEAIFTCMTAPCTVEWFNAITGLTTGITTTTITDLCPGDYFVEVVNDGGCITTVPVTIGSPTEIFANEIITELTCSGGSDASITVSPTGGSGTGYTFSWSPIPPNGDGTNEALDIGPGIWDLEITDDAGCVQTFSFEILDPTPIVLVADPTNVSCNGACDGSILISASGGSGGFTYQWFMGGVILPGETSDLLAGICPGNYNVEVTDANGCTVTLPVDVTISEPIAIIGTITSTNVTCFGFCDGTANLDVSGGSAPYIINWFDAITGLLIGMDGPMATGLCPGSYFAEITDDNGCSITTETIVITEPDELAFTLNTTDANCFGFCDGTAEIIVTGGTAPYTYTWLTIMGDPIVGGTTSSVSDLCEGDYTIEVLDANGCTIGVIPFAINGFPEITATLFSNDATCGVANGNATVFVSGGNPPYTYQWFDDAMTLILGEVSLTLFDVFSGIYFVTVTDDNGCTQTFMVNISDTEGPDVVFDAVNDPSCFGLCDGSISITASGTDMPFTYSWNPGGIIAEDPTGLCAGDYTLEVTNDIGCTSFFDTTLVDPIEIIPTATITSTGCGLCNGAIDLSITGGVGAVTVIWNTGATGTSITDLCSGIYEAVITDANGCSVTESFTVDNSEGVTADFAITSITCAENCDGEVVVSGVGGLAPYTYLWLHDGSTSDTQTGLCADSYFVQVTDANGCTNTLEVELLDPMPIQATATIVNPTCGLADGSINVMTSGGILPHTYLWNTGETTPFLTGVDAGVYILTVTDANGCSLDFTYNISNISAAVIDLIATDIDCNGNCNGTIDTLSIIGGTLPFTFNWLDDMGVPLGTTDPLISGLCAGDYILEVTDAAGCISFETGTVNEPEEILLNPLFSNDPSCNGICDGFIFADPIGGTLPFSFAWDDPDAQTTSNATMLCPGTYTITITDANGCSVNQMATLTEPTAITITIDSITDATCQNAADGEIFITVDGGNPGYTFEWTNDATDDTLTVEDPTGLLPTTYFISVTDANGCIAIDTVEVDTILSVFAQAGTDTLICFGSDLIITGTSNITDPSVTFTWFDTLGNVLSDSSVLVIMNSQPGETPYILEVSFAGCSDMDTIFVITNEQVMVEAGEDIDLFNNQTGTIGGDPTTDPSNTVIWSPAIFLDDPNIFNPSVIEPDSSMWYIVTATDTNGCTNSDSVFVTTIPDFIIPNGISPSGDGLNDTWILDFIEQYPGVEIKINVYNRWGDLLFVSDEDYADDWDGTTEEGKPLPVGTYYYVITVDHPDFPDPLTGPITIMR